MTKAKNKATGLSKAATSTGVAIPLDRTQVTVLLDKLKAELVKLKQGSPEAISLDITYNGTNIKNVTKITELLEISASVNSRSKAYDDEAKRYGVEGKVKAFTVSDKTAVEWVEIIQKAIFELINKKEIEKREAAIAKLSKFEDEQTKFQREIGDIMKDASELLS